MKDTLRLELTQCWSLCFGKFIIIVWHWISILICYFPLYLLWSSSPHLWKSLTIFFLENLVFFKKNSNYNCMASYHFSPFTLHLVNLRFSSHPPLFFGLKKHFLKDLNRISSYKYNTICLYIHFFEEHLACLHISIILKKAALKICIHVFLEKYYSFECICLLLIFFQISINPSTSILAVSFKHVPLSVSSLTKTAVITREAFLFVCLF